MTTVAERISPWEWIRRLQRQMEREADELFRSIKEFEARTGCIVPLHDVVESGDEVIVSVDLPGVKKEDISLEVTESYVVLEAPCRTPLPSSRLGTRYRLRLEMPTELDTSTVKARLQNGVLEIKAQKKKARGTKITVE
ncbi:MAG: Hsp20/alpha crystallin family protein [Nitrososphaerota archaeon]